MTEEKKKGWFQKFKSSLFGEKDEPVIEEKVNDNLQKEESKNDISKITEKEDSETNIVQKEISLTPILNTQSINIQEDKKKENNQENLINNADIDKKQEIDSNELESQDLKKETVFSEDTFNKIDSLLNKVEQKIDDKQDSKKKEFNLKSLDISDITSKPKVEKTDEVKEEIKQEQEVKEESKEEKPIESEEPKGWFSKMIDTLNSPIEIKLETADGDDSLMSKLKGNISIGLGKPIVRETNEEREAWRLKLKERLAGTRTAFTEKLERLMHGRTKIDDDLLEEIEEVLLESDVGVEMTDKISEKIRELAKEKRFLPTEVMPSLFDYLKEQISMEEERIIIDDSRLNIIMMVGVNGTGKTTTTGKIAAKLAISEYSVVLAAADTFRAAAIEQLEVWSKRAEVPLIKHQEGSDAAAVVHDAISSARAKKANVLLIDTAGRLHNKAHLMDELKKIRRIIDKEAPEAKLEVLLVLDATTGQNGLNQAMVFAEAVQLTGVVLTKLDGTAKGGVIFSIKNSLKLPIKLVGVGEGLDDLRDFQPQIFVDALFSEKNDNVIEQSTKIRG